MNRRTSIKSLLALGFVGISSYPVYKWFSINGVPDHKYLISKKNLLAELADTIIPRTDTPGAKDTGVGDFILKIMLNCTPVKSQNVFIEGLTSVESKSMHEFGRSFEECTPEQRITVLTHFEEKTSMPYRLISKVENKLWGGSFYGQLKRLTVLGYFTSKPGATEALAYDYVPGHFIGTTKLLPGQKGWATN